MLTCHILQTKHCTIISEVCTYISELCCSFTCVSKKGQLCQKHAFNKFSNIEVLFSPKYVKRNITAFSGNPKNKIM